MQWVRMCISGINYANVSSTQKPAVDLTKRSSQLSLPSLPRPDSMTLSDTLFKAQHIGSSASYLAVVYNYVLVGALMDLQPATDVTTHKQLSGC